MVVEKILIRDQRGNTSVVGATVKGVTGRVVAITLNPSMGNTGDAVVDATLEEHEAVSMGNIGDNGAANKGVIVPDVATTLNPPYLAQSGSLNMVNAPIHEFLSSYAIKLSPMYLTKANLRKLEVNVPNYADYNVWLPLASVHEMIREIPIFLNNWSPSMSLLKEDLSRIPVYVKFHDVPLGMSSYARILIEINACNNSSDNVVMDLPNLKETGYTKETIRVEYEWESPRCSTCLIFGHSLEECPKYLKRVVNRMDKGKGGSSGDDDEGFIEVKKKKSGGKCMLVVYDGKSLENDYSSNQGSEDEVESVDNEMASYMASKPSRVGYGTKIIRTIKGNICG
ncbi:putative ribonuclease H-like domain-containing protein [Tanacetum coccineum]